MRRLVVDHDLEVDGAPALGAVMVDVPGPGLALDVDQNAGCKQRAIR